MSGPMTCTPSAYGIALKARLDLHPKTQTNNDKDKILTKDAEGVVTERTFTMCYRAVQRTCRVKHAVVTQC